MLHLWYSLLLVCPCIVWNLTIFIRRFVVSIRQSRLIFLFDYLLIVVTKSYFVLYTHLGILLLLDQILEILLCRLGNLFHNLTILFRVPILLMWFHVGNIMWIRHMRYLMCCCNCFQKYRGYSDLLVLYYCFLNIILLLLGKGL